MFAARTRARRALEDLPHQLGDGVLDTWHRGRAWWGGAQRAERVAAAKWGLGGPLTLLLLLGPSLVTKCSFWLAALFLVVRGSATVWFAYKATRIIAFAGEGVREVRRGHGGQGAQGGQEGGVVK